MQKFVSISLLLLATACQSTAARPGQSKGGQGPMEMAAKPAPASPEVETAAAPASPKPEASETSADEKTIASLDVELDHQMAAEAANYAETPVENAEPVACTGPGYKLSMREDTEAPSHFVAQLSGKGAPEPLNCSREALAVEPRAGVLWSCRGQDEADGASFELILIEKHEGKTIARLLDKDGQPTLNCSAHPH